MRLHFWEAMLSYFRIQDFILYQKVNPTKANWLNASSGLNGCTFCIIFGKTEARTDVYLNRPSKEENKKLFDFLYSQKHEIESAFGTALEWQRLDDKKACRIKYAKSFDGYDEENWPEIIRWIHANMSALEIAIKPILKNYKQ